MRSFSDANGGTHRAVPAARFVERFRSDAALRADPAARARYADITAHASVCSFCGVGCPYTVVPDARGVRDVEPLSDLGLCVKGRTSLLTGGHAQRAARMASRRRPDDRIRRPMIRNHDGAMIEVSWEEALDRAAWLFLHVREWVGPEGVAVYGNGQKTLEAIWLTCLYKLVFNLPTIGANSEHCLASAGAAHELNFGNEASFTWQRFAELSRCDVAVLHGTNPLVTFPQAYEKLKRNSGAVKVVIDPVRTDTVSDLEARDPRTLHIRFQQGGDVLFNLAVARVILDEGWADRAYLEQAVDPESLAEFEALCAEDRCHPDAVARQIALEEDEPAELAAIIRRYAALLARPGADGERPRPAFVSSMGINQSTGSFGFSTNLNLLLLTGNVGREGAGSLRIAGQSNATSELMMGMNSRRLVFNLKPTDAQARADLARVLDIPLDNIPTGEGTPVVNMADDDLLYCFLFVGTQMTRNMPRLGHWMRRIGRSFNIVIDSFFAQDVLDHADVILPAYTYTERTGVIQRGDRTLQLQQQVSPPPPDAWSDTQILTRLALAIAKRLRDPHTAALNHLDPAAVERAFGRYTDEAGHVDTARVFDHLVETSRALDVYCRLEDAEGTPISHQILREHAGDGVQWQGDARYATARSAGEVFPGGRGEARHRARLVRPPEVLLRPLVPPKDGMLASLISGRGRPGRNGLMYRARYNSGVKTRPITKPERDDYWLELHPADAEAAGLEPGGTVRMTSHHGSVIGRVHLNDRVPRGFPFVDFVPGQINRLTDYVEVDQFTNQSLIKRTPVRLAPLNAGEAALWAAPDPVALDAALQVLDARYHATYPTEADWEAWERRDPGAAEWLPRSALRDPSGANQIAVARAASTVATFLQRYDDGGDYQRDAARMLNGLTGAPRERFLRLLLPILRTLDYHTLLVHLLRDVAGPVTLRAADGSPVQIDMLSAHKAAVLELKEEVVAVQIFLAVQRGIEILFGPDAEVPREDLAFVSGIAIPCAGDVPSFFMGVAPSDLQSTRLVHSRAIGVNAVMVVDRRRKRAVRMDIVTGVLPKDRELLKLRVAVITRKQSATRREHRRFFDRLGELIAKFVRDGDNNYAICGPAPLDWEEFSGRLAFSPPRKADFQAYLEEVGASADLVRSLVELKILDPEADAALVGRLCAPGCAAVPVPEQANGAALTALLTTPEMSTRAKVEAVIEGYIEPVLKNDGGRIELLGVDEDERAVTVRFVGSCANCPYSMLSLESIVKPALLEIPGVDTVVHRGRLRVKELERIGAPLGEVATRPSTLITIGEGRPRASR